MKLALVSGEFPPQQGGVGDYTRELAREFARRAIEVRVITSPTDKAPKLMAAQGEHYALHFADFKELHSLGTVDKLARDCDVVHIQYQAAAYGMTPPIHLLPRYLRLRRPHRLVVITFHDLRVPYLFPKAGPLRWKTILYFGAAANAVVLTNQEDLQRLRESFKGGTTDIRRLPSRKLLFRFSCFKPTLSVIPIGSNIDADVASHDDRAAARAALGVPAGETLLCYFGFLNTSKGGETLMHILAELRRAGYAVRLLMLGGETGASDPTNAAYAQKVKALGTELGIADRIIWAGYRPASEVTALWHASDIALLPYADGVSLRRGTLMAALAHAMPIVSTRPRAPIEQLCDGKNIALADAGDVIGLAQQVSSLIDSPVRREQLSLSAAKLAQTFAWPPIASQHLELYRQLLGT